MKRLYIRFKSLVNDFVYSVGHAALLLLVEVYNHTVPVQERGRIRFNVQVPYHRLIPQVLLLFLLCNKFINTHAPNMLIHFTKNFQRMI